MKIKIINEFEVKKSDIEDYEKENGKDSFSDLLYTWQFNYLTNELANAHIFPKKEEVKVILGTKSKDYGAENGTNKKDK